MKERVFLFGLEGKKVLGFDTGLDPLAFAQAKMAAFVTQPGSVVLPDGRIETWIASGVVERGGTMVVWGPAFSGRGLDDLIAPGGPPDEILDALRYWLRAWPLAAGEESRPWPAGALVAGEGGGYPGGTIFFPPERLVKRCLEAEGSASWRAGAGQWVHPDLKGPDAAAFTGAAMLYRALSGSAPFSRDDDDLLSQDIREGVFLPPRFAAPGLEDEAARLIGSCLAPPGKDRREGPRPSPEELLVYLGPPASRKAASCLRPLGGEEAAALGRERERFSRRKNLSVNTRRFVIRNTALIAGAAVILAVAGIIAQSVISSRASRPTTRGMSPEEVVRAYYGAFGDMDHQLMEACVINGAGKGDINMVTNFFVFSRMRQAYEFNPGSISAQDWLDAGSPEVDVTVFGVTDLKLEIPGLPPGAEETRIRAAYRLWIPESSVKEPAPPDLSGTVEQPRSIALSTADELTLVLRKGSWRIAEILREDRED